MTRLEGDGVVVELEGEVLTLTIDWSRWRGWWLGVEGGARLRHVPPALEAEVLRLFEGLDPVHAAAAAMAWRQWRATAGRVVPPPDARAA